MTGLKQRIKQSPVGFLAESVQDLFTRNGMYNRQTVQVMRRVLRADSNCIDIGAHLGAVLKDIVAIAPHGQHIAFEPLPELAERLRVKFPGVTVVQQAVSDRVGQSTFQHVTNSPAYSGLQRRVYDRAVEIEEITVERVRLDDVIRQDLEVALIKLDIEGGEYDALKGGVDTIRRCRPILVFEASIGSTGAYGVEPDALYFLITQTLGYRLATMSDWFRGIPGYDQATFRQNWYDGPEFYFIAYP